MNRLTSGLVSSLALLLTAACSTEPTNDLSNGGAADRLIAKPSEFTIKLGETKKVVVGAVDAQGNQLNFTYEKGAVGPGLVVERDFSYLPIFIGVDASPVPPTSAPEFQFLVTATDLVSSSFSVTAGGKEVVVPVIVVPDPLVATVNATASAAGATAQDPITLTLPAPYIFTGAATVTYDLGDAVVLGRSADGTTLNILPIPGSTGPGTVTGIAIGYAPTLPLTIPVTTDPITAAVTVNPIAGTDAAATAPTIDLVAGEENGFIDTGTLAAADCGQNSGAPCALYKFSLAEDTDVNVRLQGSNDADLGLYFINEDGSDNDNLCDDLGRAAGTPEACTLTFTAGNYLLAVVSFGPFYPIPGAPPEDPASGGPDPNPDWVAVQLAIP